MTFVLSICDATETGGTPPVTMTNDTTPPPWRWQAEETTSKPLTMFPPRETIEECPEFKRTSPLIGGIMMSQWLDVGTFCSYVVGAS